MARVVCFAHCYRRTRHTHVELALLRLVRMAMAGEYPPLVGMAVADLQQRLPPDSIDAPITTTQTLHSLGHHLSHTDHSTNRYRSIVARTIITPITRTFYHETSSTSFFAHTVSYHTQAGNIHACFMQVRSLCDAMFMGRLVGNNLHAIGKGVCIIQQNGQRIKIIR